MSEQTTAKARYNRRSKQLSWAINSSLAAGLLLGGAVGVQSSNENKDKVRDLTAQAPLIERAAIKDEHKKLAYLGSLSSDCRLVLQPFLAGGSGQKVNDRDATLLVTNAKVCDETPEALVHARADEAATMHDGQLFSDNAHELQYAKASAGGDEIIRMISAGGVLGLLVASPFAMIARRRQPFSPQ